jgi:hypothetical protein
MSPAEVVSSRSGKRAVVAGDLSHVIGTMQSWIDGAPVWPYQQILDVWGSDFEMYRARMHREISAAVAAGSYTWREPDMRTMLDRMTAMMQLRCQWIGRFGFAIPCAELLDELAKAEHVVEVGAGSGYMTRLMRHRGIDVIGSDYDWAGPNSHGFMTALYDDWQETGVEAKTMVRRYRDSTVFCSWPTLKATWFRQMLKAMRVGQRVIIVREDACAEDTAWQYLYDCFDELATIDIPAFDRMNDYASVHVKKRQNAKINRSASPILDSAG